MKSIFRYIFPLVVAAPVLVACADDLIVNNGNDPSVDDKGLGELVLFSAGSTENTTTRASVIPYMEQEGRFVCKMFYHAGATDTDASPFDTISTPITSWLRVNDNEGNSVYWKNDFDMEGVDKNHQDYIDYGFDSRAQYFYWRNRLDHIFLGFTDYNKLKSNTYGKEQGKLFMYPEHDGVKKTKTGTEETWNVSSYRVLQFKTVKEKNPDYDEETAAEQGDAYEIPEYIDKLIYNGMTSTNSDPSIYGENQAHHYLAYSYSDNVSTATLNKIKDMTSHMSDDDKALLYADLERHGYSTPETTAEGTFKDFEWEMWFNEQKVDPDTKCADLSDATTVIYCSRLKQEMEDIIAVAPANTFDLTRKDGMTSITDQPDPLIALTKMKPTGATQEANRVRLYFKHQFSQIQVNLTNAENTAELKPENIVSVELLGVSKKGYVFTNINPNGTQIPPTYDPVVISQYTEAQLKKNQYGTSFNMFDMGDTKPTTSLKSFNAIAFGQLQAIRITWQEDATTDTYTEETAALENKKHLVADTSGKKPGEDGYTTTYEADYTPVSAGQVIPPVKHVATYKITVDDRGNSLVNLKSGFRYMYDFELRRGTIAFIRATIDGWLLSDDLNYGTSGTIKNE